MPTEYRIGVFPSGSEVAAEIFRSLQFEKRFTLIGLSSTVDYGDALYSQNITTLPYIHDRQFIEKIRKVVAEMRIDILIPAMDEVGYTLKCHEEEIGCDVIYANLETAGIIRKKTATYRRLQDLVPTPKVVDPFGDERIDFPVFSKPDIGYGSRKVQRLDDKESLDRLFAYESDDLVVCEFLPGQEITVDCFSGMDSDVLFCGPRTRRRIRMGISVSTDPLEVTPEVIEIARIISVELKMTGCWFFQLKQDVNNEFRLLEVASRVSGSMAMYRLLGVNFILMTLYQHLGFRVSVPALLDGHFRLERALDVRLVGGLDFDSVYVDLDDCLIVKGRVNVNLVAFLYACHNAELPVFLVTRHQKDLEVTLSNHRLDQMLDDIYLLKNGESKASVISHEKALFIDDSYAEREQVKDEIGVITLSPDMVHLGLLGHD